MEDTNRQMCIAVMAILTMMSISVFVFSSISHHLVPQGYWNSTQESRFWWFTHTRRSTCQELREEITIVTAFFYLGEAIPKGIRYRRTDVYFDWMTPFKVIQNPVVAYFNRVEDADYFKKLRKSLGPTVTKVFVLEQSDMWAFKLMTKVQSNIGSSPMLDRNKDAAVLKYASAQQAKYEVVLNATLDNSFCSRYIMWLDIGYYLDIRDDVKSGRYPKFSVWIPTTYNTSFVAYTAVRKRDAKQEPIDILIHGGCWLGGGAFLANVTLMEQWTKDYMAYTEHLATKDLIFRTDQETLYSWTNSEKNTVLVQVFGGATGEGTYWRYLGYLCKDAGQNRSRELTSISRIKNKVVQ